MIELLPETQGSLVALKFSGVVTEADQDRVFDQADAASTPEKVEHLLFDWEDLEGWGKGARSAGTWFGMHHRALVGRVAIVADEKWQDEVLRISDIFNAATVRRFEPGQRRKAIDWILAS